MGITFRTMMTISESFRDILKRQQYELLVLDTLNRSTKLIRNLPLERITEQSNSQSDFVDLAGNQYDVKLLIDKKQGSYIGERKNDITQWIKSMMDESAEFSEYINLRGDFDLTTTKLYTVVKDRLQSLKEDEIGILFCPYPIVNDAKGSVFLQFATDFLQAVYDKLDSDGLVRCKGLYFLYPSMEKNVLCLRNGKTRVREYIESQEIGKYISFDTMPSID